MIAAPRPPPDALERALAGADRVIRLLRRAYAAPSPEARYLALQEALGAAREIEPRVDAVLIEEEMIHD